MMAPLNRRPMSYVARERLAKEAADARHADRTDEGNVLRRRVRAELLALTQVADIADHEWHRENDAVPAPRAVGGAALHPSRVRALAAFVAAQGWSANPADPVEPTATRAEMLDAATAETKARLAAAEADLAAYEAEKRND